MHQVRTGNLNGQIISSCRPWLTFSNDDSSAALWLGTRVVASELAVFHFELFDCFQCQRRRYFPPRAPESLDRRRIRLCNRLSTRFGDPHDTWLLEYCCHLLKTDNFDKACCLYHTSASTAFSTGKFMKLLKKLF